MTGIRGIVCAGQGQGRSFTRLDWVRRQFRDKLGFDPYPGTLNLQIEERAALARWRAHPGIAIEPSPGYCAAKCHRVRIDAKVDAVWIVPQVPGYREDVVELIAAVSLRESLHLQDGDAVWIQRVEGEE
jgi:riboflavin kinase